VVTENPVTAGENEIPNVSELAGFSVVGPGGGLINLNTPLVSATAILAMVTALVPELVTVNDCRPVWPTCTGLKTTVPEGNTVTVGGPP